MPRPSFDDYLREQTDRDDAVGDLARVAVAKNFDDLSFWWESLGNAANEAMNLAEREYNEVCLERDAADRERYRDAFKRVMPGGAPGLGRNRRR